MSDNRDTMPAPSIPEAKLGQQLAQLELAVARVGELCSEVMRTVNAVKVSQLTTEHRTHVIHEAKRNDRRWLADLERRMRAAEAVLASYPQQPPPAE